MKGAHDILWQDLALGFILLAIPLLIFSYYKTGMSRPALIAVARMTVQLLLVGLYLQYIFYLNSPVINLLWVALMIIIASYTVLKRSGLRVRRFLWPVLFAMTLSILFVDFYFLVIVLQLDYLLDARFLISISGMLIGNCLSINVMGLTVFYEGLEKNKITYEFSLANGATQEEALRPFIKNALQKALNPLIATTSVVGLISLPGMMTGQILGGSNPAVAIKYQIMIMLTIFVSALLTVVLSILVSNRFVFDEFNRLKKVRVKK